MRVVFFGLSGPFSLGVLSAVALEHDVVGVVGANRGPPLKRFARRVAHGVRPRTNPLAVAATRLDAPYVGATGRADPRVSRLLARTRPDAILIAKFPWILPERIFGAARVAAVNVHPSLLPRHRGPLPHFWVYYHDDAESGVTAHHVTAEMDSGPILAQSTVPVERGLGVDVLVDRKASLATGVALEALAAIESGDARGVPQAEGCATSAPFVQPDRPMVDFASWPVERVWHFLAGLHPRFREPLADPDGKPARYRGVSAYREEEHGLTPGSVRRDGPHWLLHCRGGVVVLDAEADTSG